MPSPRSQRPMAAVRARSDRRTCERARHLLALARRDVGRTERSFARGGVRSAIAVKATEISIRRARDRRRIRPCASPRPRGATTTKPFDAIPGAGAAARGCARPRRTCASSFACARVTTAALGVGAGGGARRGRATAERSMTRRASAGSASAARSRERTPPSSPRRRRAAAAAGPSRAGKRASGPVGGRTGGRRARLRDGEWSLWGHTYRLRDEAPISFAWSDGGGTDRGRGMGRAHHHVDDDQRRGIRTSIGTPSWRRRGRSRAHAAAASARVVMHRSRERGRGVWRASRRTRARRAAVLRLRRRHDLPVPRGATLRSLAANVAPSNLEPGDAVVVGRDPRARGRRGRQRRAPRGCSAKGLRRDRVNDEGSSGGHSATTASGATTAATSSTAAVVSAPRSPVPTGSAAPRAGPQCASCARFQANPSAARASRCGSPTTAMASEMMTCSITSPESSSCRGRCKTSATPSCSRSSTSVGRFRPPRRRARRPTRVRAALRLGRGRQGAWSRAPTAAADDDVNGFEAVLDSAAAVYAELRARAVAPATRAASSRGLPLCRRRRARRARNRCLCRASSGRAAPTRPRAAAALTRPRATRRPRSTRPRKRSRPRRRLKARIARATRSGESWAATGCACVRRAARAGSLNEHCSDMRAHHGQCPSGGRGRTPTRRLPKRARAPAGAAGGRRGGHRRAPADVSPLRGRPARLFNGAWSAATDFADTDWERMPLWDEHAKGRLERSQRHRRAAATGVHAARPRRRRRTRARARNQRRVGGRRRGGGVGRGRGRDGGGGVRPAPPTRAPPRPIGAVPAAPVAFARRAVPRVRAKGGSHSGHTCNADGFRGMRGSWPCGRRASAATTRAEAGAKTRTRFAALRGRPARRASAAAPALAKGPPRESAPLRRNSARGAGERRRGDPTDRPLVVLRGAAAARSYAIAARRADGGPGGASRAPPFRPRASPTAAATAQSGPGTPGAQLCPTSNAKTIMSGPSPRRTRRTTSARAPPAAEPALARRALPRAPSKACSRTTHGAMRARSATSVRPSSSPSSSSPPRARVVVGDGATRSLTKSSSTTRCTGGRHGAPSGTRRPAKHASAARRCILRAARVSRARAVWPSVSRRRCRRRAGS